MNDELKMPPLPTPVSGEKIYKGHGDYDEIEYYSREQMRAYVIADRAARPVADAGDAVGYVSPAALDRLKGPNGSAMIFGAQAGDYVPLYRAAPSARALSTAEIEQAAWNYFGMKFASDTAFNASVFKFARAILAATSAPAEAPSDDPIGDLQAKAKQAKLDDFIASTRDPGAAPSVRDDTLLADLYELTKYAACSQRKNTPEFLAGLFEQIEALQPRCVRALQGKPEAAKGGA